ncbi:dynein axonemal assembly factor 5 isoform X2 [Lycorma delicatula]|uniref:dynein axonemal assembly factor 5 isoform X2 n=1 Tax=Lycorma delicatula TaxID=130591 RepID=UPI003F50EEC4
MDSVEVKEILLHKHCNALQSTNKRQRKNALETIKKELIDNSSDENTILQHYKTVQKYLIRCIRDDSESCREYAVSLITQVIEQVPMDDGILGFIFPELRERMGGIEIKEPSEEVRLLIVILLHRIVLKYGSILVHYLDDYIEILKKTIIDPYPKVKKESCECAADLSKAIPQHFHMQSESLIKPILLVMYHQHYRIRVAAIKSLGDIICNGNNKSVSDVTTALAERLFDQNPIVRKTVAEVVGMWLIKLYDRYSYWHKLIPLMLTSLCDEIHSQAEEAWKLWEIAGSQWVTENENDIKDKLDFLPEEVSWYPNGVRRPNIGCRELVQREMSKYLPAIVNELTDWKVDIKVKSAQLLCTTIQHAEQKITQHISKILPAMYKAFCDEDKRVVENIQKSAELIGYFVLPEVYCGQILPAIEDGANYGNLGVLACAIKYSPKGTTTPKIKEIANIIDRGEICYTNKVKEQEQLLNLISGLLRNCPKEWCNTVLQQLFNVLVYIQGITGNEDIKKDAKEYGVVASLDIILIILKSAMEEGIDPEVVLKILWAIFDILQNDKLISILDDKKYFFEVLLTEVLIKQLVWKAGRSAEALRTASAACLSQGLYNMMKFSSNKISSDMLNLFLPHLLSLVEDSVIKTRLYSLESLQMLIRGAKYGNILSEEHVNTLIPVVLKRLDDVSDVVRLASLKIIRVVYKEPTAVCGDHIVGLLHNTLLIHMDDTNEEIRNTVLDTLKDVGKANPEELLNKITVDSFREEDVSNKLIKYLKSEISNKTSS